MVSCVFCIAGSDISLGFACGWCITSLNVSQDVTEKSLCSNVPGWRTAALILGSVLVILIGVFAAMFASGWRFQRSDQPASLAGASASAEKWSPPLGPGESAASRVKRLAHDLSSLSIAATNRPDPGKVLAEARDMAGKGEYEGALQRHIWYHNHALDYGAGQSGVRLSFALSYWTELGRKFPKAMQALTEIRDRDKRELADDKGDFALFQELAAINRELKAEDDTMVVFKGMVRQDFNLANQCYPLAEEMLVRRGEYELCLRFIADSQTRFDLMRQERERGSKMSFGRPEMKRVFDDRFVGQVRALVEILVANGRKSEAERIRTQALAVMDAPRVASAVDDAEAKVGK